MPASTARHTSRHVGHLLEAGSAGALARQARELARLARAMWPQIGSDLAAHCALVRLDGEALVLAADSPAWAARLRLEAPRLLAAAAAVRPRQPPRRLVVRVSPALSPAARGPAPAPRPRPAIGPGAAALLAELSESTADPALRSMWRRLAAHGRR